MKAGKWLAAAAVLVLCGAGLVWLQSGQDKGVTPAPAAAAKVTAVAPRLLPPSVATAAKAHDELLEQTQGLEAPAILPAPGAAIAAASAAMAAEQAEQPAPPKVDDAKKIALFFTGNAIGETDPCG